MKLTKDNIIGKCFYRHGAGYLYIKGILIENKESYIHSTIDYKWYLSKGDTFSKKYITMENILEEIERDRDKLTILPIGFIKPLK